MADLCECCSRIWRNGKPGHAPAAYVWTCQPSGHQVRLCVECCAGWRRNAVEEPSLAPERIVSIEEPAA